VEETPVKDSYSQALWIALYEETKLRRRKEGEIAVEDSSLYTWRKAVSSEAAPGPIWSNLA